jgi:hypothetical protein
MYFGLSDTEKALFTCNGQFEPRQLLRSVVEKKGRNLNRGATSEEAHRMLSRVVENNLKIGKSVKFTWRRQGQNQKSGKGWKVTDLQKSVLSKPGKYVLFGKAKKNSEKQKALIRRLNKLESDEEVVEEWGRVAEGYSTMDHAVGIIVSNDLSAHIVDNGCTYGIKDISYINLADRLEDVNICFKFDLTEE